MGTIHHEEVRRTYLDNAATAWPKPPGVLEGMIAFQQNCGAAVGRGASRSARYASSIVRDTKERMARLIHGKTGDNIALLANGTQALNGAILGLLREGDHVVTTAAEHNSLLRPLAMLQRTKRVDWTMVDVDQAGVVSVDGLRAAIRPNTKLIAVTHASNVTGAIQPIHAIAEIARKESIWFLLDAAQTIGYVPIDVEGMGLDLLAAPGHKGLGGMLGTGVLYACPEVQESLDSPWIGGTGSESDRIDGPFDWSNALESGNPNGPAIASLQAALQWIEEQDILALQSNLHQLTARMWEILNGSGFRCIGPSRIEDRVPVVSVTSELMSPQEWAGLLDSSFGIETRAGLHCAGRIHPFLKTEPSGTLRFSLGHMSLAQDLDRLELALKEIGQG